MRFTAAFTRAKWDALIVASWMAMITLLLLRWAAIRPTDWLRFVLLCLAVIAAATTTLLLYGAWGLLTLQYEVDRNAVRIHCRRSSFIIPLGSIKRVIKSERSAAKSPEWWRWPANYMRAERRNDNKLLTMFATRPLHKCILLEADSTIFALSPTANEQFLSSLQENYRIGPIGVLQESENVTHTLDLQLLLGVDRVSRWVLLSGLIGVGLLFILLLVRYPFLPDTMAVRFDRNGIPDLVREKSGLFLLPMIGLVCWVINGLWGIWMVSRNQVIGAYLLWGGAVIVQICLFFALLSLAR